MADSPEAIKKSVRLYFLIGGVLFLFTLLTVAVASFEVLDFGAHGFDTADMVIGLAIASLKAGLVAAIFMHLNHEKKLIYLFFAVAIFFGLALFALTALAFLDPIYWENFFT